LSGGLGAAGIFDVSSIAARLPAPPLPVIHDEDDPETCRADSERIATSWPGARLVTATGLGHRRIPRSAEAIAEAVAFIGGPPARQQPGALREAGAGGAVGCPLPRRPSGCPGNRPVPRDEEKSRWSA